MPSQAPPHRILPHPRLPELVGGLELSTRQLKGNGGEAGGLYQMFANAEYWLSFDVANFEALLAKCPSPLRELGVAIVLRFGEQLNGELTRQDIERARTTMIPEISRDLREGIDRGLDTLGRAVRIRDEVERLEIEGFKRCTATQGFPVHALRAGGRSTITVDGYPGSKIINVPMGEPVVVSALDERQRPLVPPDVESNVNAPVLMKSESEGIKRHIVFMIPGEYRLRVPGRALGDRRVVAS